MRVVFVEDGNVVNVAIFKADEDLSRWEGTLIPHESASIGWSYDGSTFTPPPSVEPVTPPVVLSTRQAKLQLSRAGLLNAANTAIGTLAGQAGEEARIEWEYATELRRDHPLVAGIGEALDLSPEAIDELFAEAAKIG